MSKKFSTTIIVEFSAAKKYNLIAGNFSIWKVSFHPKV
jgi:hypothetical protein